MRSNSANLNLPGTCGASRNRNRTAGQIRPLPGVSEDVHTSVSRGLPLPGRVHCAALGHDVRVHVITAGALQAAVACACSRCLQAGGFRYSRM
jgi:hypothetical protein